MKISKIIITFLAIFLLLIIIATFFPKDGVNVGSIHLHFPSLSEALLDKKPNYVDIDSIVDESLTDINSQKDSTQVKIKSNNIVEIELPNDNPYYLDNFFTAIQNAKTNNKKVRIIHYGDSQIEGDRITSYIRMRMQKSFGGSGQGQIPIHSLSAISNIHYTYSPNIHFYSIIDPKQHSFKHYGLMQSASVPYIRTIIDTITNDTTILRTANINIKFDKSISGNLTLYCSNPTTNSRISIFSKNELIEEYSLIPSTELLSLPIHLNNATKSLHLQIKGSPELYSLDFSFESGVYVDNVSLRGSSGYGFSRGDSDMLTDMSSKLNVKLIILQFGVNAIPQDNTILPGYNFYKSKFSKQITYLKKTNPNAAIIVIGVSDRSINKNGNYITNPNIPKLLAAQKSAAEENGVAFWNLFQAMGGENSMPSWVQRKHPLANTDFIHFNTYGAKYVAEMFYQALETAYKDFQNRQ